MRWPAALLVVSVLIAGAPPIAHAQGGAGKAAAAKKRPKGAAGKKKAEEKPVEEQPSAEAPKESTADASKKDAEATKKEAEEKKKATEPERKVKGEKSSGEGPSVVEVEQGGEEGVKTYKFGPVEVEGRLKAPQVVYFMRRVRAEFSAGLLGHRSFLRELGDTRRSPALR
jgi:hypothetical protein